MKKTSLQIADSVRNARHPVRQVAKLSNKPLQHRYERRKIREVLRTADWENESE